MRFKLDCLDNRRSGDHKAINKIFIVIGEVFLLTYFFIGILNLYSLKFITRPCRAQTDEFLTFVEIKNGHPKSCIGSRKT